LTTALKFKFADVIVNCSRILRRYAALQGDERNYETYDQYSKQYQNILDAEIRSEEFYQRVTMNYHKPPHKNQNLEEKIDIYCNALVGLSESYESPIIFYNMYLVWAYRYEMLNDYNSALQVCENAEQYIEQNPRYYQDDKLATFQLKKMNAYLHLGDYKNGKVNAEKCLQSFPEGSKIWFTFMEYYLLMALHTDNYINALAIYKKASSNTKFKRITGVEKEKWKIYDIYLNYIIESQGANNPILRAQKRKSFRLSRFLNDSILYPKDQRIFTVHLLIAQVLFLIEKNSYSAATERIDRLKNYANRQLKKDDYFRAIQFIRLLQQLSKVEFRHDSVSNVEKYYSRLIEQPFKYRGLLNEIEIIPYEKLWQIVLERVRK